MNYGNLSRRCIVCGRKTKALSGICIRHEDGGVTGDLYQRIRAACGDISAFSQAELDEHALNIARVVTAALGEAGCSEGDKPASPNTVGVTP